MYPIVIPSPSRIRHAKSIRVKNVCVNILVDNPASANIYFFKTFSVFKKKSNNGQRVVSYDLPELDYVQLNMTLNLLKMI